MVSELKLMNKNFLIYNRIKIYRMKFKAYIKKLLRFLEKTFNAIIEERAKLNLKIREILPNLFLNLTCITKIINEFSIFSLAA